MDKIQLRKQVLQLIGKLSTIEKKVQSEKVFEKLIKHPKYKSAKRFSIYLSTENEIDTIKILKHALELDNKRGFIPLVRSPDCKIDTVCKTRMILVELPSMKDYERLPINNYGIKEPPKDCTLWKPAEPNGDQDLDLIILPGLAFGCHDNTRLGHGKGYYDEFLTYWFSISSKKPYLIGLAFNEQLIDNTLAIDGYDFKVDEILTAQK